MSDEVESAADTLYGAALSAFTAERKRLADTLKAAGSKAAAAAVGKLARPSMSAWVVNQLWRKHRKDMEDLLAAGVRVREGDRGGLDAQRLALARLRSAAADVLTADDHAASPATLQRVATTLQALSALGTWDPDAAGRLLGDRDPPGFDVMMGAVIDVPPLDSRDALARDGAARPPPPKPPVALKTVPKVPSESRDESRDELAARRAEAERKAAAEKATRARVRAAEKALLERAVDGMKRAVVQRTADLANARAQVEVAESALARARAQVEDAEAALATAEKRVEDAEASLAAHDEDE